MFCGVYATGSILLLLRMFPSLYFQQFNVPSQHPYQVSVVVDGVYSEHSHTAGTFSFLSSSLVYVGGSEDPRSLRGSKAHSNFVGCLRKVEFTADTLKLNLIDLVRTGSKLISVAGRPEFMCQEVEAAEPVTFTTSESHLILPPWDSPHSGSVSLKMRTSEPDSLLMFNGMAAEEYFALEILDGHLYLHLDLGSGSIRVKAAPGRVDDSAWHEIWVRREGREGSVTVDGTTVRFSTPGESSQLDLDGPLLLGGVGSRLPGPIPPNIWTVSLRRGFVGCVRDLVINGRVIDIAGFARKQDGASIKPWCRILSHQCIHPSPCLHGGKCFEGWNRFICDCSSTAYSGPTCAKEATLLSFNGSQHVTVWPWPEESHSQAEEMALRFRTTRPLGLLLLSSTTTKHFSPLSLGDRVELALAGGRIRLTTRLGDAEKVNASLIHSEERICTKDNVMHFRWRSSYITVQAGHGLNDNQWHTVRFSRRGFLLKLQVDNDPTVTGELNGKEMTLVMDAIHIGGIIQSAEDPTSASPPAPNFVGHMQHLTINGRSYFEMAKAGQAGPKVKVTARYARRDPWWSSAEHNPSSSFRSRPEPLVHHPVTFRSKHTYVGLRTLRNYGTADVYFQMKTLQPSGLILYNAGRDDNFFAVELVGGHIHYVFDLGDGPVRVRDNARMSLNDGKWHGVTIGRPSPKRHTLMVDDHFAFVVTGSGLGVADTFDLDGILYVGGIPRDKYENLPEQIVSRHGFEGCLASLDLGGETPSLIMDAIIKSPQVTPGCEGMTKCSSNTCANHGSCVQQWNSFECDCDMTSFTGPTCSEESVAYEFGSHGDGGLITYTFPEEHRPQTKGDTLAVGFSTSVEDSVLVRVDSGVSHDYLELEIVEGNIFVVYNMGTNDHPIGETGVKVNDNAYHVVRFTRTGANSTLQLDNYPVQSHYPSGHQLTTFNGQASIQIGGRWSRTKRGIERPFMGIIAGLSFNGRHILDLAADLDPHISLKGDVRKVDTRNVHSHMTGSNAMHHHRRRLHPSRHPTEVHMRRRLGHNELLLQRMQQTPASEFPGTMDDLVFSGAGSGCNADDEDECTPVFDTGSGDDLITPVYVPPTRPPPTAPPKGVRKPPVGGGSKPCDDEDCFPGSGSGEAVTTEDGGTVGPDGRVPTLETDSVSSTNGGAPTDAIIPDVGTTSAPSLPPPSPQPSTPSSTEVFPDNSSSASSIPSFPTFPPSSHHISTSTTELPPPPRPPPPPPAPPELIPTKGSPNFANTNGRGRMPPRISSEAAENTALIIGIIAGAMIAIILIILVILKFKGRTDGSYKVDDSKSYGYGGGNGSPAVGASTTLLPPPTAPVATSAAVSAGFGAVGNQALAAQMNGTVRNGDGKGTVGGKPPAKRRELKDIKEWYV
ncbi:hypothetical protein J437_LFUL013443 [Ladona fulva]|uniref:Neurexin n=1 Tax=Ladona fulva TaxID=123851 RepID=A0A8K0KJG8_LADFU|nr:hypothetical protein J437_LFUL013443 [Ladona fulva]